MSDPHENLLQQITIEAARNGMRDAEIKEMISEVRAHLDASIQARLEMGASSYDSSREATTSFGDAKAFVTSYKASHRRTGPLAIPIFLVTTLAILCGAMASFGPIDNRSLGSFALYPMAIIIGVIMLAVLGWTSAFIHSRTMLRALVFCIPAAAVIASFFNVGDGSLTLTDRRDLMRVMSMPSEDQAAHDKQFQLQMGDIDTQWQSARTADGGFLLPTGTDGHGNIIRRKFTREEALRQYNDVRTHIINSYGATNNVAWQDTLREDHIQAENARQQLSKAILLDALLCVPAAFVSVAGMWIVLALSHMIGALGRMGSKMRILKRRIA